MSPPAEIRTETRTDCLLCGEAGRVLYTDLGDRLYDVPGRYGFLRCPRCGFVWLSPRPRPEELRRCYPRDYAAYHQPPAAEANWRVAGSARDAIRALILSEVLGYTKFRRDTWWAPPLGHLLAMVPSLRTRATFGWQELCPPYQPGGTLLDVGCGAGTYLSRVRELGWEVVGVELSPQAAQAAREAYGVAVHVGTLEEVKFPDGSFAVVTMTHLIEHVPDPLALLRECYRILQPGGRLIVTTPNLSGVGSRLFKSAWLDLDPPRHLWLFAPDTLRQCVERAGFEIERTRSRAYHTAMIFELSQRIRRAGSVRDHQSVTGKEWRGTVWAWLERWLRPVWRFAGEELMVCGVSR
ncbi:MAG: class I SAM-dependent methyltransferase [Nitrospiraceae bacterium]